VSIDPIWHRAVAALGEFVDLLPPGPHRDFQRWLSRDPECAQRWLQVNALRTQVTMINRLLHGLLTADETVAIADYAARYNVYLTQEVVSDNLAIGLAGRSPRDSSAAARAATLTVFNAAMIGRLRGREPGEVRRELARLEPVAAGISLFDQSLAAAEHRALAARYLRANPTACVADIEFGVAAALAANVESGRDAVDAVAGLAVANLFTDGLVARYSAVGQLIEDPPTETKQLLCLGTSSILVIPTLAFMAGVLAEIVTPEPDFFAIVADGSLTGAITAAALLVRLLNDTGTRLLEQPEAEHDGFLKTLRANRFDAMTVGDLVTRDSWAGDPVVTRLTKDVQFGEFNVCLDGIRALPASDDSLDRLGQRLDEVRQAYRAGRLDLRRHLAELGRFPRLRRIGDMIVRFVDFHRVLYRNRYDTRLGEYGIDGRLR
jgi:hypothetical protein